MTLFRDGFLPHQNPVLQRYRDQNNLAAQALAKNGIPCKAVTKDLDILEPVVKVCTFHSAKGLEFEIVLVCGLDRIKFQMPVDTSSEEFQELLDQERKLLYVGMTRARTRLYITYSGAELDWILNRLRSKLAHR